MVHYPKPFAELVRDAHRMRSEYALSPYYWIVVIPDKATLGTPARETSPRGHQLRGYAKSGMSLVSAIETQHIEYFLAICDELNFTRAAKNCGVARPTITVAIQRMERKVGGPLFRRLTHPPYVQLTALGRQLYPICVQISELLANAQTIGSRVSNVSAASRITVPMLSGAK